MTSTSRKTAYAATAFSILSFFAATTTAHRHVGGLSPLSRHARIKKQSVTYSGCYSSNQGLDDDEGSAIYQTSGFCAPICQGKNMAVLATGAGSNCYCGNVLPPADSMVDDSSCNSPCNGYDQEMCGGDGFYSVYLTGIEADVANFDGSSSSSSSSIAESSSDSTPDSTTDSSAESTSDATSGSSPESTTPIAPATTPKPQPTQAPHAEHITASVITSVQPGQTVRVTLSPTIVSEQGTGTPSSGSNSDDKSGGSGTNTAGIAAGVVVGVVAAAAIIGAAIFFIRRRKRQQGQEENRRANQVTEFMHHRNEPKPPNSAYSNTSDSRLDPEAGAKRNSAGSIADDQDFSRRILRVANPDR